MASGSEKLPVWQSAENAYRLLCLDTVTFFRIMILPYCLSYMVGIAAGFIGSFMRVTTGTTTATELLNLCAGLFQFLMITIFIVAWHRFTLLDPAKVDVRTRIGLDLGRREIVFASFAALALSVIWIPYYFADQTVERGVLTLQETPVIWAVFLLYFWPLFVAPIMVRLSLLFPSTAVGRRLSIGQSWVMTRGNVWRLLTIFALCGIPWSILRSFAFPYLLLWAGQNLLWVLIVEMALLFVTFLGSAVAATSLSLVYRWIVERDARAAVR